MRAIASWLKACQRETPESSYVGMASCFPECFVSHWEQQPRFLAGRVVDGKRDPSSRRRAPAAFRPRTAAQGAVCKCRRRLKGDVPPSRSSACSLSDLCWNLVPSDHHGSLCAPASCPLAISRAGSLPHSWPLTPPGGPESVSPSQGFLALSVRQTPWTRDGGLRVVLVLGGLSVWSGLCRTLARGGTLHRGASKCLWPGLQVVSHSVPSANADSVYISQVGRPGVRAAK